jgi:hypothetical protein
LGYIDIINHRGVATVSKSRNGRGYVNSINHSGVATVAKSKNGWDM